VISAMPTRDASSFLFINFSPLVMPIWLFGCKRCAWHAATDVKQQLYQGKGHAMKISHASDPEATKTLKFSALFWYRNAGVSQNSTDAGCDTGALASWSQPSWGGMNPSCGEVRFTYTDFIKPTQ
jgi:hypothetical protein